MTLQKADALDAEESDIVQVDFSSGAESVWSSVCAAVDEVRCTTSTLVVQPCRTATTGRGPPTSSMAVLSGGQGQVLPTAVVAPIKREPTDQVPLVVSERGGLAAATPAEKYSLPPFETLVTAHRSPDTPTAHAAAPSPSTNQRPPTTSGSAAAAAAGSLPPQSVAIRLPGIHQLFQTTSGGGGQPVAVAGTGSGSSSAVEDEATRYAWSSTPSHQLAVGPATSRRRQHLPSQQHQHQQLQFVQFFDKTDDDLTLAIRDLPQPPPYPGSPGATASGRAYMTYGGGLRASSAGEYNFHPVMSSARR